MSKWFKDNPTPQQQLVTEQTKEALQKVVNEHDPEKPTILGTQYGETGRGTSKAAGTWPPNLATEAATQHVKDIRTLSENYCSAVNAEQACIKDVCDQSDNVQNVEKELREAKQLRENASAKAQKAAENRRVAEEKLKQALPSMQR